MFTDSKNEGRPSFMSFCADTYHGKDVSHDKEGRPSFRKSIITDFYTE